jgi:hypothetical protein
VIQFQKQNIQPPFSGYISAGDFLQVNIFTTAPTTGLTLSGRVLAPHGSVYTFEYNLDGASISTFTTKILAVSEGFLVSLSVTNLNGGLADQTCFVAVGLQSGPNAGLVPHTMLAHGYVSNLNTLEWPPVFSRVQASGGQTYTAQSIQVTAPAAGAEWLYTVGAGITYTLKSVSYTLATSGAGISRYPLLVIKDGTHVLFRGDVNFAEGPGSTFLWTGATGIIDNLASPQLATVQVPIDMPLAAGFTVGSLTLNLDVADQYSNISLGVLKWN